MARVCVVISMKCVLYTWKQAWPSPWKAIAGKVQKIKLFLFASSLNMTVFLYLIQLSTNYSLTTTNKRSVMLGREYKPHWLTSDAALGSASKESAVAPPATFACAREPSWLASPTLHLPGRPVGPPSRFSPHTYPQSVPIS